jgi:hypothetical protein
LKRIDSELLCPSRAVQSLKPGKSAAIYAYRTTPRAACRRGDVSFEPDTAVRGMKWLDPALAVVIAWQLDHEQARCPVGGAAAAKSSQAAALVSFLPEGDRDTQPDSNTEFPQL